MSFSNYKKLIEQGIRVGDSKVFKQDKIWSCYSNDKVDIGERLAKVIRTLSKAFALNKPLRAFSIGSSNEPQFRLLETNFRAGLYLLDIEEAALDIVKERIKRQATTHVKTIRGDYNKILLQAKDVKRFSRTRLQNKKINLITLHHSLYYCREESWHTIFANLYRHILSRQGAMHTVLMTAKSNDPYTTTWIYNHFAGKFFGHHNNQDLKKFKKELKASSLYNKAQIDLRSSYVRFFVDDFEKFMSVIWMILLYPQVHSYSLKQREHITESIYKKFWIKKRPLLQAQDHLVVYRGLGIRGII
jgi:hypothetical protein